MSGAALFSLALADFRERTRGYGFLVTLLLVVGLGYAVNTGQVGVHLSGTRGQYNSAWVGSLMALATNFLLSLVGFYVVKNALERDRATGVGQILAATRLTKVTYTLGKWLSNFGVLAAMIGVVSLAAVAMQVYQREAPTLDLWALLAPLLLVSLTQMALVAALAVLFEAIPGLRGNFGNLAYFGLWVLGMALFAGQAGRPGWFLAPFDPFGIALFQPSMSAAAHAAYPGLPSGFTLSFADPASVRVFPYPGIAWTLEAVLSRLALVCVGACLALVAALPFDRFDAAAWPRPTDAAGNPVSRLLGRRARRDGPVGDGALDVEPGSGADASRAPKRLVAPPILAAATDRLPVLLRVLLAELRLGLKGLPWWWLAVALGVVVACLTSSPPFVRATMVPLAFAWPIFVWSSLGAREARHRTGQLVFSAAHPIGRQLPASWLAGVTIAALAASGALVRFGLAGDVATVEGLLAGAVFVPSLALALGVWTGSGKSFQVVYLVLCYFGLANGVTALDFLGLGPAASGMPAYYLALTPILLGAAALGRVRQLRG